MIAGRECLGLGPRVPALVISPWAAQGIFHHSLSFDSVLNLIETLFRLPKLPKQRPSEGPGDPAGHQMVHVFDFSQPPRPPLILKQRACP